VVMVREGVVAFVKFWVEEVVGFACLYFFPSSQSAAFPRVFSSQPAFLGGVKDFGGVEGLEEEYEPDDGEDDEDEFTEEEVEEG